jgi:hypothetical protein
MRLRTAVSIVLISAGMALAQEPPRNAALDYWRAGAVAANAAKGRDGTKETAVSTLNWDAIGANLDPAKMPPQFEAARKEVSEDAVREFMRGAAAPACDFQTHAEDGWKMLLPELAIVRDLSRMVRVDARAKLMDGDAHAAAERVEAMYSSAGHVARENVLISSLVAVAISRAANNEVKALAGAKLTDADRERLLSAIAALRNNDGLHIRAALDSERRLTTIWIRKEFAGEGGPARFVKELIASNSAEGQQDKDEQARAVAIAAMSAQEFSDALAKVDVFYGRVLAAWAAPDPKQALAPIERALVNGEYGPVARALAPSLGKALDAQIRAHAELDAAAEALKKQP